MSGIRSVVSGTSDADPLQRAVMVVVLPLAAVVPRSLVLRLAETVLLSRPRSPVVRAVARVRIAHDPLRRKAEWN